MRLSYGVGRAQAGEPDLVATTPEAIGKTGVIVCHAAGHTASTFMSPNNGRPLAWSFLTELSKRYPTMVSNQALDNFGNDAGIATVAGARTHLQSNASFAKAKAGKVILIGVSMGFTLACNYAYRNLANVAGIVGIVPLVDLDDVYTRNPGGTVVSGMNAAYGGTYDPATMSPVRNPIALAPSITVPIKLWYGTADTTILPERVVAFDNASPNTERVALSGLGHDTEGAYPLALANGLLEFLESIA